MDKANLLYFMISSILFILPLIAVFIKLGRLLEIVDMHSKEIQTIKTNLKDSSEKTTMNFDSVTKSLHQIEVSLTRLATKIEDSKI